MHRFSAAALLCCLATTAGADQQKFQCSGDTVTSTVARWRATPYHPAMATELQVTTRFDLFNRTMCESYETVSGLNIKFEPDHMCFDLVTSKTIGSDEITVTDPWGDRRVLHMGGSDIPHRNYQSLLAACHMMPYALVRLPPSWRHG